jgi:hypothetical protein
MRSNAEVRCRAGVRGIATPGAVAVALTGRSGPETRRWWRGAGEARRVWVRARAGAGI